VGLTKEELTRVVPQHQATVAWSLFHLFFGHKIYTTLKSSIYFIFNMLYMLPGIIARKMKFRPLFDEPANTYSFMRQDKMRSGELSSANTHACARGLALIGTIIVNDGKDSDLVSADTCAKMHAEPMTAAMNASGTETTFSQGGVNFFKAGPESTEQDNLRKDWVGWMGLGGSVFQWHPELKISFAYVPSLLQPFDYTCLRGAYLQSEVVKCVESIKKGIV